MRTIRFVLPAVLFAVVAAAQTPGPIGNKTASPAPVLVTAEKISPRLRDLVQRRPAVTALIALYDQPQGAILERHTAAAALSLAAAESRYQELARRPFAPEAALAAARDTLDSVILETRRRAFIEIDAALEPLQTEVERIVVLSGGRNVRRYSAINMLSADLPRPALEALERSPLVARVFPVEAHQAQLDESVPELGAPAFWNAGWTGAGQSVAVLDTGVRPNHPAFAGKSIVSRVFLDTAVANSPCFDDSASSGEDVQGHGTHVAGIVMSQGSTEGPNYRGVARGLGTLYNIKIGYRKGVNPAIEGCDGKGSSYTSDTLAGIDWVLRNTAARIVNYSYGGAAETGDDDFARVIDQYADTYGVMFAIAAGNAPCTTVNTPGLAYNILSVANWSVRGTISASSCRGPTPDGRQKPDLAAPGTGIIAPWYNWDAAFTSDYVSKSGTSMAAPHVAGSAALLYQAGVNNALAAKAVLLAATDNTDWASDRGWGYLNLNTALAGYPYRHAGSVKPRPQPGYFQLYRVASPNQFKAALTWNRHIPNPSTSVFHDLDLYAYGRGDNTLIAGSVTVSQNVEQVAGNAAGDVVLKAVTYTPSFAGGVVSEPYAIAVTDPVTAATGPVLSPSCTAPAAVPANTSFTINCRVRNNGDLPAFSVSGLMALPMFGIFGTYSWGTVQPGATSADVGVTFMAPAAQGTYTARLDVENWSYGEKFTGTVTFSVVVAQSCAILLNPTSLDWGPGSLAGVFGVTTSPGCPWTAVSNSTWLAVTGGSPGNGSGTVSYSVAANGGPPRSGTIHIGGVLFTVNQQGAAPSTGMRFVPVAPCRIMDTRETTFPAGFGTPYLAGGTSRSVAIPSSRCGIPSAAAYALNVTVVPRGPLGYLTIWPTGQPQPWVSTLNSGDGLVTANAAIVPAGANGAISVFVTHDTDVILDINGYFTSATTADTLVFYPLTPCRVADTRDPSGAFGGPAIAGGGSRSFPIASSPCGAPSTARAYSLNVTVVPQGGPLGYLTIWPSGSGQPFVSTLNAPDGLVVANAALVPAGTGGAVSVFASQPTHVILDINGYFAPPGAGGLHFYPVAPCRIADTRDAAGTFGGPILGAAAPRSIPVPSSACNVPSQAAAYSLNTTVAPSGPLGYLTVWPAGLGMPLVSTLNSYDGQVTANAALVPAGANGAISVFGTNPTHVIFDIGGYFAP